VRGSEPVTVTIQIASQWWCVVSTVKEEMKVVPSWRNCRTDGIRRLFGAASGERRVRLFRRRERSHFNPPRCFARNSIVPENRHAGLSQYLRLECEEGSDFRRGRMGAKQDEGLRLRRWPD